MPNVTNITEAQLRNWVRDFRGTGLDLKAMAELQRRGLPVM